MSVHTKTAKLYKRVWPSKIPDGKGCEIKGGGHEMAAMMWMIRTHNSVSCSQVQVVQMHDSQVCIL